MYETLKSWYYKLFGNPTPIKKYRKLLTKEEVAEIEAKLLNTSGQPTYSQVELAISYGVSTSVISKIHTGKHRFSTGKYSDDTDEYLEV